MASVFLASEGIFMIDYLEKGETLTGEYYKQGVSTGGFGHQSRKSGKALRFEWQVHCHPFLVPAPMSICLDTSLWKCW